MHATRTATGSTTLPTHKSRSWPIGSPIPVEAAEFPASTPALPQSRAGTESVGLHTLDATRNGSAISAGSSRWPDNLPQPLALRYHGHQFRVYNPEIGDGRGFLFAQMRDADGRLLDLGTKGSGTTPYSRTARRAADAERRGARDPGDRNARSAGREHLEDLLGDRNRRRAGARRRALAHPLRRDGAAQPRAYPHRQFPAAARHWRRTSTSTRWSTIASPPIPARRRPRMRRAATNPRSC